MKFFKSFRVPTAYEIARRELLEAERQLLAARTDLEMATANVSFRANQTARLEKYLAQAQV